MDTVAVDGVDYVRASVLAKEFKYTTDYIGQLCRSRKIDAKLVGRTWYVSRASLDRHQSSRYAELRSGEKSKKEDIKKTSSRIDVEPRPSKKTAKALQVNNKNFINHILWKPAAYETDESELLPPVAKSKNDASHPEIRLPIELAEADKVEVSADDTKTKMHAEPLPAVVLGGTIKIRSLEEAYENNIDNTSYIEGNRALEVDETESDVVSDLETKRSVERKITPELVEEFDSGESGKEHEVSPKMKKQPKFTRVLSQNKPVEDQKVTFTERLQEKLNDPRSQELVIDQTAEEEQVVPISFALVSSVVAVCVLLLLGAGTLKSVTVFEAGDVKTSYHFEIPKMNFSASIFGSDL